MYVYKKTESSLWTVGFHDPEGKFHTDSDHDNRDDARARVHYLNGGAHIHNSPSLEQLAIGIMAAIIMAAPNVESTEFGAVTIAREIMDTVYKTEPE